MYHVWVTANDKDIVDVNQYICVSVAHRKEWRFQLENWYSTVEDVLSKIYVPSAKTKIMLASCGETHLQASFVVYFFIVRIPEQSILYFFVNGFGH